MTDTAEKRTFNQIMVENGRLRSELYETKAEIERLRTAGQQLSLQMMEDTKLIERLRLEKEFNADQARGLDDECKRLRAALEQIGWMDEFLDADGARAMMNIARKAINESSNEQ